MVSVGVSERERGEDEYNDGIVCHALVRFVVEGRSLE